MSARILLVEDNPVSAKALELNLQRYGYRTLLAHTAQEAMAYLADTPRAQLIITDIMMPDMDGFAFLQRLKEHPTWRGIPVIMATAMADVASIKKAFALGCRHYIVKPIRSAQLLQVVREVLDPEKPILRDPLQVMAEAGLDLAAYWQIARIFREQVGARLIQLEGWIMGEAAAGPPLNLLDLSEGAALLGAERVLALLESMRIKGDSPAAMPDGVDYPLLLRELQLLQAALTPEA
jgi:CheY-like chemotaxis protein